MTGRGFGWMARVVVGDDSHRRAPPGDHKGSPLRMPLWGAFLRILLDCAVAVRGGARGGGRRFPPPGPARRPQGIAPTDAPVGHVQRIPVCAVIYFHNNDGTGVWVDGARCGGRRFPPPCPARRPQGIAPTDAPVGRVQWVPVFARIYFHNNDDWVTPPKGRYYHVYSLRRGD